MSSRFWASNLDSRRARLGHEQTGANDCSLASQMPRRREDCAVVFGCSRRKSGVCGFVSFGALRSNFEEPEVPVLKYVDDGFS